MADKNDRSQGKRISYDILNNLSSVNLFYDEKKQEKDIFKENFRCLPGRAADSSSLHKRSSGQGISTQNRNSYCWEACCLT